MVCMRALNLSAYGQSANLIFVYLSDRSKQFSYTMYHSTRNMQLEACSS